MAPVELGKSYPAIGEAVAIVRRDVAVVASYLGAEDALVERMRLASSEAATNVVENTFEPGASRMRVAIVLERDDMLLLKVSHRGTAASAGREGASRLGFVVMRSCAEEVNVRRTASGGTEIELRFALGACEEGIEQPGSVAGAGRMAGFSAGQIAFHAAS